MILFKKAEDLQKYMSATVQDGATAGFVPTMGALHAGHLSLIAMSKEQCSTTVCSIFVNPTQFTDKADFEKYPVATAADILLLEKAGCDILFLPEAKEIYPQGTDALTRYDLGLVEHILEGKYRPGHFQGVCQVVHRLLSIVQPHKIFLGQKDYQQCIIINRLLHITGSAAQLVTGITLREKSGLAMSSRNQRLTARQRLQAAAIYNILEYIRENIAAANANELCNYASGYLQQHGFTKVDYVTIADAGTLQPATGGADHKLVALVAAHMGSVRLIDNIVLG